MATDYSYMDKWSSNDVAKFKEEAEEKRFNQINIEPGFVRGEVTHLNQRDVKSGLINFNAGQIEFKSGLWDFHSENKIVAEGDSWFDYLPGTDLIDCLRSHHGYSIKNYAKAGDTLENMIYGIGIDENFQRTSPTINKVLKKIGQLKPKIFLFSGGGNDVAGEEFTYYLNHRNSSLPTIKDDYVNYMINIVFKKYFSDLIDKVHAVSPDTNILAHGYGHTIPTGKGVRFLFFNFSGPWLRPALAMKGIFDSLEQRATVERMIDSFNEMLKDVSATNDKFHHIDLRPLLDPEADWANELHLRNSAYAKAADAVHKKIVEIES